MNAAATGDERNQRADFVGKGSVVRRIWGDGDMVLVVFAGCAAEFALNRAVDWLFFTGKLPGDPIGRLFSTAGYPQSIVCADEPTARMTFARIRAVHHAVESKRGERIPDWAHRDVLYMLIDYSERAHELLARPLSEEERRELYEVFHRVGTGLGIPDLPASYFDWKADRVKHLQRDLDLSKGTRALLNQYRAHLGSWRYEMLLLIQSVLVPERVRNLLGLKRSIAMRGLLRAYPFIASAGGSRLMRRLLMPAQYLAAVNALDYAAGASATTNQSHGRHTWELLKVGS